jgi:tetratricopeptide (TPR) repeat protein
LSLYKGEEKIAERDVEGGSSSSEEELERTESILKKQNELLKVDPRNANVWFAKSVFLCKLQRYDEAIESLNEVTKLDPDFEGVWGLKAKIYAVLGERRRARLCWQRAIGMKPIDSDFRSLCPLCATTVDPNASRCVRCGFTLVEKEKQADYFGDLLNAGKEMEKESPTLPAPASPDLEEPPVEEREVRPAKERFELMREDLDEAINNANGVEREESLVGWIEKEFYRTRAPSLGEREREGKTILGSG